MRNPLHNRPRAMALRAAQSAAKNNQSQTGTVSNVEKSSGKSKEGSCKSVPNEGNGDESKECGEGC